MDWALVGVLERLGKQQTPGADGTFRVTLGDVLMAAPPGSGSPDLLRDGLLAVLRASRGAYALSDAGEVVFCFPSALRAAVLKHSASERLAAWRRKAARFAMVCARVLFAFMLVFSLLLALLAIIAIFIISVTQGGRDSRDGPMLPLTGGGGGDGFDGGGGGGPGYRHDGFGDLYLYLMLRDINMAIWMTEADRRHAEMQRVLAADVGAASPSKPGGRPAPGGGGAPPPGGEGDGGGEPPPPPPPPTRWFDLASEEEDAAARHPSNSSLSFVESVFAFVFGRPSPNEDLEPRRMRAIGMLLRACGCGSVARHTAARAYLALTAHFSPSVLSQWMCACRAGGPLLRRLPAAKRRGRARRAATLAVPAAAPEAAQGQGGGVARGRAAAVRRPHAASPGPLWRPRGRLRRRAAAGVRVPAAAVHRGGVAARRRRGVVRIRRAAPGARAAAAAAAAVREAAAAV